MYIKKTPDDGQRNCPKHVEFYSKNKFEKLVHLVGFVIRILLFSFRGPFLGHYRSMFMPQYAVRSMRQYFGLYSVPDCAATILTKSLSCDQTVTSIVINSWRKIVELRRVPLPALLSVSWGGRAYPTLNCVHVWRHLVYVVTPVEVWEERAFINILASD